MQADEQVAGGGTVTSPIAQGDQGIAGPGHPNADPAPLELVAEEQADLEGDVFFPDSAGKVSARIAGIDSAVARIDGHDVAGAKAVGESRAGSGCGRRRARDVFQPGSSI